MLYTVRTCDTIMAPRTLTAIVLSTSMRAQIYSHSSYRNITTTHASKSSGVASRNFARRAMPALFTTRSMGPAPSSAVRVAATSAMSTQMGIMEGTFNMSTRREPAHLRFERHEVGLRARDGNDLRAQGGQLLHQIFPNALLSACFLSLLVCTFTGTCDNRALAIEAD
jgi:hypothetical protein